MSTTAEDISTTLSEDKPVEPSVDKTDAIAELLIGEDESESEDKEGGESPTELSTQDDDEESNEDGDAEDEVEAKADDDVDADELSWGSVLGVSEDKLSFDEDGNLVGFVAKVNGEATTLTADELLAGWQTNKAVTTKAQTLAEERKAFEDEKEQVTGTYSTKLESVDALSKYFEKQLISEYDEIDWTALRNDNPAEYAALKADFQDRASEMKKIQEAIAKDRESEQQKQMEEFAESQKQYLKQQFDQMLENNPEWADEKVRNQAKSDFVNFVGENYGFTVEEFDSVFDARLIELIKDAKRYHEAKQVASKKRGKPVPKFQKSVGGSKRKTPSQLEKLTAASKKARGAAKRDLQASAVAELLTGQ